MDNRNESQIIKVEWSERWQVYDRLKALEIECDCQSYQPLSAYPSNATTAIQLWSVVKQFTANRQELIDWLNQCWQIKYDK
ncbi:MAG: hypothetical protein QNJ70_14580 [Xenococcaceae cyanobacterium MO_207.B15]|nr:hypothetical protein [Xenococcaceae cyanobacterium MO_207.B15]MDJ0746508.1 hypothetical protein [Xenococcaceae cyanobacterium MO_167.B27]